MAKSIIEDTSKVRLLFSPSSRIAGLSGLPAVSRMNVNGFSHGKTTKLKVFTGEDEPQKFPGESKLESLAVSLKTLLEYLKSFKVEEIELWISGAAETGGFLNLVVSAKGEGGIKVVLKPLQ